MPIVVVSFCCVTNDSKSWWFKTTAIYLALETLVISLGQVGLRAAGFMHLWSAAGWLGGWPVLDSCSWVGPCGLPLSNRLAQSRPFPVAVAQGLKRESSCEKGPLRSRLRTGQSSLPRPLMAHTNHKASPDSRRGEVDWWRRKTVGLTSLICKLDTIMQ